jgi:large subunit ribosomal protein L19
LDSFGENAKFVVLIFSWSKKMDVMKLIETMSIEKTVSGRKAKEGDNFTDLPDFKPGDQVNIAVRVIEGEKERIQNFKGIILKRRGGGVNQTFLVRKISNGIGVERNFPLYSPMIQSITLLKKGRVRRAKLYYLRGMSDKKIRQKIN